MQFLSGRLPSALPSIAAIVLSLTLPLALPLAVFAQDDDAAAAAAPASGGVARIDAISGEVAIQRGDSSETLAAAPNAPVLAADYVTTGQDGRAEVGFDGRAAVRLGENVQIRFVKLEPADRQMQLAAGTVDLRLFGDSDGRSAIDTPSISIVPRTSGSFRVSVDNNGETAVTVRVGRADIVTPQGTQSLEPGTTLVADGPAANPALQTQPAVALDNFDGYNRDRDHIYQIATADSQYVNTNIQGIGDLDANGRWADDGSYGHVWIPSTVATDWAPYRDGNWTWEDGYGWTWVAAEPWGWAPYHYGRWYFSTAYRHWAWYPPAPGRFAPAWSPALVGFVGFNIGAVSVGIGFGNIGWVPLAPFEAFHPWWGPHGTTIVNNTTFINNTTVINNTNVHYRNLEVNNAMTSVTRENFQNGRFGNPRVVSQDELRTIHTVPMRGALPIVPGQANLRFTQRTVAPSLAARPALTNRAFAGQPAAVPRTPFNEQQASVSRATHIAYRSEAPNDATFAPHAAPAYSHGASTAPAPAAFSHGAAAPAYAHPAESNGFAAPASRTPPNDSWSRFNANRNVEPAANHPAGAPAYARPAAGAAPTYVRAQPAYTKPTGSIEGERAAQPQLAHPVTPQYTHPVMPQYSNPVTPQYARPVTPQYSHPVTPEYARPVTPAYARPVTPAYPRPVTPAYARPVTPAYTHPVAPAYTQPVAPAYSRQGPPAYEHATSSRPPATTARPEARSTHTTEDHHER